MSKLFKRLLRWLQSRCDHPSHCVVADYLEGDHYPKLAVKWCRRCGSIARTTYSDTAPHYRWRRPDEEI